MKNKINKQSIKIKIFGCLLIIIGGVPCVLSLLFFLSSCQKGKIYFDAIFNLITVVGVLFFTTGVGLLRLKPWARFLIIGEAIYFGSMSVGSVFGDLGIPLSGFPDDSIPLNIWALPLSILSSIFWLSAICFFTRRHIKGQFKPIAILERNKVVMVLTVALLLSVSIIWGVFLSCSHRELWARLFSEYGDGTKFGIIPSSFHLLALNICQFIRLHELLVVLVILILCFGGAVAILVKDKYRRIK